MHINDLVLITANRPHSGEVGRIVEIFWCFVTVQFGSDPDDWDVYFSDELAVISSPSTTSLALIGISDPSLASTVN